MDGVTDPLPSLEEIEREAIVARLAHFGGRKPETARSLGIALKTLYNRLNAYDANPQPIGSNS